MKRPFSQVDNERSETKQTVRPELGAGGYYCMELFCGSGNLTFAMKHFFPDSFGVDHKVAKQKVKVICYGFISVCPAALLPKHGSRG